MIVLKQIKNKDEQEDYILMLGPQLYAASRSCQGRHI
jgi:hypothetical protein